MTSGGCDPSGRGVASQGADLIQLIGLAPRYARCARLAQAPLSTTGTLLGREDDLRALQELLASDSRLVTLTGPPGVGKSALARAFASDAGPGVVACDLGECRDADDVLRAISGVLGGRSRVTTDDDVAAQLRHRDVSVLVLDSAEHLTAELAAGITAFLRGAPKLTVLVASRERLHHSAEHAFLLSPLPLGPDGPATELVLRRARQLGGLPLDDGASAVATRIAAAVDGLPLAIELVTTRLSAESLHDLAAALERPLNFDARGPRDAAPRHGSLGHAVGLSWSRLTASERSLLRVCAVFAGGIGSAALIALWRRTAKDPTSEPPIPSLVEKSLLRIAGGGSTRETRYAMYRIVREFVLRERDPALLLDHAEHFVERLGGKVEKASALLRAEEPAIAVESSNLAAVVERGREFAAAGESRWGELAALAAVALEPVYLRQGPLRAYEKLLSPLLEVSGISVKLRCALMQSRGYVRYLGGRYEAACSDFTAVRKLIDEGSAFHCLATIKMAGALGFDGRHDRAEELFAEAEESCQRLADDWVSAEFYKDRGTYLGVRFRREESRADLQRALAFLSDGKNERSASAVLVHLGSRAAEAGALRDAVAYFERTLAAAQRASDRRIMGWALTQLGLVQIEQGQLELAEQTLLQALAEARSCADAVMESSVVVYQGHLMLERHNPVEAARCYRLALAAKPVLGPELTALTHAALASAEALSGHHEIAVQELTEAQRRLPEDAMESYRHALALLACHLPLQDESKDRAKRLREAERTLRTHEERMDRMQGKPDRFPTDLERFALRLLKRSLRREALQSSSTEPIWISKDWDRVRIGSDTEVDLRKRPLLQRLLRALTDARVQAPGESVRARELVAQGWPGERMAWDAAKNRLRVAINQLRRRGLAQVLITTREGYLLDPACELRRESP